MERYCFNYIHKNNIIHRDIKPQNIFIKNRHIICIGDFGIEKIINHRLPIVNCIKCLTFWIVLIFCLSSGFNLKISVAISFLSSYIAIWLELFFGYIDICYEKIYDSIYKDSET